MLSTVAPPSQTCAPLVAFYYSMRPDRGTPLLHANKWGIVPLAGAPDGANVSFVTDSVSGCSGEPVVAAATAAGGRVGVSLPNAGRFLACLRDARASTAIGVVRSVELPQPIFGCEAFGDLCRGVGVLTPHDVQLARAKQLKVFLYRDLPAEFHWNMVKKDLPEQVRRGQVCDFFSRPCSPTGPSGMMRALSGWFTGMKNVPDVPLLSKLLGLAAVPGVGTDDPAEADVFVVPFLGGFAEHNAPWQTQQLDREPQQSNLMTRLLARLPHFSAAPERHLFLLTHSCNQCHRKPCTFCAKWHRSNEKAFVRLAATLGPRWQAPDTGFRQLVVPPLFMHEQIHHRAYVPLCASTAGSGAGSRPSSGSGAPPPLAADGTTPLCRPNSAARELLLFYQGAHVAGNDIRNEVLSELSRATFGSAGRLESCSCQTDPHCCVNRSSGVAFFHSRSHWQPKLPLGFEQTVEWMQRATFCVCPGGDVTYNQRYYMAIFSGCIPVIFGFTPSETLPPPAAGLGPVAFSEATSPSSSSSSSSGGRGGGGGGSGGGRGRATPPPARTISWWKPKGPANAGINPFATEVDHDELVVELPRGQIAGFAQRLREVPADVIERKQRAIEAVRHLFLYDASGARVDAFSMMLRELVRVLPPRGGGGGGRAGKGRGSAQPRRRHQAARTM